VRPFVSFETIQATYEAAARTEAAVPVINVVETIRYIVSDKDSKTVPRSEYRLVQTPQVFSASLLRAAYNQPCLAKYLEGSLQTVAEVFTDDASVVEKFGHRVTLVSGNRENIKITTPFDLAIASALL
jgi:2-C-methyl-D-erythritol 4-phosphate cytidylyltransferase